MAEQGVSRRACLAGLTGAVVAGGAAVSAENAARAPDPSPSAAQADVRLLRTAYEALHPGLLRYLTASEAADAFDRLHQDCARPGTLEAFYVRLSAFLARLKCGHSYANFYNQRAAVQRRLFDNPDRLPLQFVWLGERMVATADPADTGIAPGSEVLRLNGRRPAEVLRALTGVARADGGNDAKRRRLMSVLGQDGYESFDVFYPLLFGSRDRHVLDVEGPDGRRRRAVLPSVGLDARRAQRPPVVSSDDDTPRWTMRRIGPVAILTMPGWALYNTSWDWAGWLDREIDGLIDARVRRLIVDVRANEGGLDCGDALIARLIARPVVADTARRLVRYRTAPEALRPHLDTWDRGFDTLGAGATPVDDRFLALPPSEGEGGVIAPRGRRFTGAVDVLIGPQNSSATFAFAQTIKRDRLGRLVGEPTGGNRRGINGGAFYFLRLPETGIEVDLPLIGTFPVQPQPDAGIEPDLFAPQTREAIAAGRDPAMEAALA